MIFHSLDYVVFFLVVVTVYWRLGHRLQNYFLLLAGYFFYGYVHPWFLILIAASTVVDFSLALGMQRFPDRKKQLLVISVLANLGLLSFFKYFNFFVDNFLELAAHFQVVVSRPMLQVALPVGISFYTFQSLSYTIDVYRGRLAARTNFIDYATFVALFPQLVAGPIERAGHVLPQVENPRHFDPDRARVGLTWIFWGFFKKLVIADNMALITGKVNFSAAPGFWLMWVCTLAFAVQIYADFSAYSDIARGSARFLGFELMENFNHPYISQTPAEFWRRWHISLSSWFRDYVYIPLGGNRVRPVRHYFNLWFTFLLSGLWHGASWNFVIWGAYHGTLLIIYQAVDRFLPWLVRARALTVPRVIVFFALTTIGWTIFMEPETKRLFENLSLRPGSDSSAQLVAAQHFALLIALYSTPLVVDTALAVSGVYARWRATMPWILVNGATLTILILGIAFLRAAQSGDFIYFQF